MKYIVSDDNEKVLFSTDKKDFIVLESGNVRIEFIKETGLYKIIRTDGKPFDGITEYTDAIYLGDARPPQTLDKLIEIQVEQLTDLQLDSRARMFEKFYWNFNDDKTEIIIHPIYEQNKSVIMYQILDKTTNIPVMVSFGKKIRVLKR